MDFLSRDLKKKKKRRGQRIEQLTVTGTRLIELKTPPNETTNWVHKVLVGQKQEHTKTDKDHQTKAMSGPR